MARLSDEDRKAVRKARDEFMRRLFSEQSGVSTREDADFDKSFTYMIDGEYALIHDDLLCPNCRSRSIGQFSTYIIREWPGS